MNNYGYQQYKEQSVSTMTSGEMLLLLYDETIKRLGRAELALQHEDYNLFDESIERASDIVLYLMDTLDKNYPISAELVRMYNFFLYEFSRIRAGRNMEILKEVKPLIMDLRNTFKEADKISGQV